METMAISPVAVSAPGKVLFTGGFLVLDRKHTGLVLGLDARIHVHIDTWQPANVCLLEEHKALILVRSPQFNDANWLYTIRKGQRGVAIPVHQVTTLQDFTTTSNKFVETTVRYALTYLESRGFDVCRSCCLTILADESYYSTSTTSGQRLGGFLDFCCRITEAHKTGLGSSAALVTAITTALITWHTARTSPLLPQHTVHNLAQAAHCAAQGKVGSGFDVAAAVFGSCLYRRFTPTILENIGEPSSESFAEKLRLCVDDLTLDRKWDVDISSRAVQLPKSLLLLMCDVDCGSETPGMVRQILAWRKEKPDEVNLLWNAIQVGSDELCRILTSLSQSESVGEQGRQELEDTIDAIRSLVREMSEKSGVPVEPPVITQLLDFCTSLPGVVGGVAPGAGGYDAVALLVDNNEAVIRDLENRLSQWEAHEEATGVKIGKVQLLKARQAYEGARYEDVKEYTEWLGR